MCRRIRNMLRSEFVVPANAYRSTPTSASKIGVGQIDYVFFELASIYTAKTQQLSPELPLINCIPQMTRQLFWSLVYRSLVLLG
nr:hypothetical protein Iba_chr05aCG9580 [Ipomoea batatas]